MTKADQNEHLKHSMKAVNCLLILKNTLVCFELPSAVNDDCEEYEKNIGERANNSFSSFQLHCPVCLRFPLTLALGRTQVLQRSFLIDGHEKIGVQFMIALISQHCQSIHRTHQVICIYFINISILIQIFRKKAL